MYLDINVDDVNRLVGDGSLVLKEVQRLIVDSFLSCEDDVIALLSILQKQISWVVNYLT